MSSAVKYGTLPFTLSVAFPVYAGISDNVGVYVPVSGSVILLDDSELPEEPTSLPSVTVDVDAYSVLFSWSIPEFCSHPIKNGNVIPTATMIAASRLNSLFLFINFLSFFLVISEI